MQQKHESKKSEESNNILFQKEQVTCLIHHHTFVISSLALNNFIIISCPLNFTENPGFHTIVNKMFCFKWQEVSKLIVSAFKLINFSTQQKHTFVNKRVDMFCCVSS